MKHDYTDEKILYAWNHKYYTGPAKRETSLRAFLDALPERPQSQPDPWPGQQEAIDAAFVKACDDRLGAYLVAHPDGWPKTWPMEAHARLAIAQAYDKARPQAAEMAALKDALFQAQEAAKDLLAQRDKAQGILKACLSVMPFGNIETHTAENLPGRIADLASEIASLSLENEQREAELAACLTPATP